MAGKQTPAGRLLAVIGRMGVSPMVRLSIAGRRLLAYLAIRGQPVPRGLAAAELWPDLPEDAGRANLRRALWQLPRGWAQTVGDELAIDAEVDLSRARLVARAALAGERLTFDEIELLSNDLLPGWHDEWLRPAQDAFRLLRVQALEAACRTMARSGEYAEATQAGAAALSAEPLRESAAEALILAHLAQSNRYQAVQCFRDLSARLHAELGVAPDPSLAARLTSLASPSPAVH